MPLSAADPQTVVATLTALLTGAGLRDVTYDGSVVSFRNRLLSGSHRSRALAGITSGTIIVEPSGVGTIARYVLS